jgi:peptidyl-prolyl cis-trans isomerase D
LTWSAAETVTRGKHGSLDTGVARQVFQANAAKLPQYVGSETQNGYTLVRIDSIKEGEEINDEKRARYMRQLRQLTGEEMFQAYMSEAKRLATIRINLPETSTTQP